MFFFHHSQVRVGNLEICTKSAKGQQQLVGSCPQFCFTYVHPRRLLGSDEAFLTCRYHNWKALHLYNRPRPHNWPHHSKWACSRPAIAVQVTVIAQTSFPEPENEAMVAMITSCCFHSTLRCPPMCIRVLSLFAPTVHNADELCTVWWLAGP